jgi:hypothetical protein
MFRRDPRLKTAFPIAGDFDSHRPVIGSQFLGGLPLPVVYQCFFTLVMLLVTKVRSTNAFGSCFMISSEPWYSLTSP